MNKMSAAWAGAAPPQRTWGALESREAAANPMQAAMSFILYAEFFILNTRWFDLFLAGYRIPMMVFLCLCLSLLLSSRVFEALFARTLRDAFALEVTDVYRPFREIASAALTGLLAEAGVSADPAAAASVLDGFGELVPHPDAGAAVRRLRESGIRIVALTNGSAVVAEKLLRASGLAPFVERAISIDEVRHWKPRREVYLHAANRVGVDPRHVALVSTHAWDIHGAGCAGLTTAFVARGQPFPNTMEAPHIAADTLVEVADALVELSELPIPTFSRKREKVSRECATDEGPHPTRLRRATLSRKRERVREQSN